MADTRTLIKRRASPETIASPAWNSSNENVGLVSFCRLTRTVAGPNRSLFISRFHLLHVAARGRFPAPIPHHPARMIDMLWFHRSRSRHSRQSPVSHPQPYTRRMPLPPCFYTYSTQPTSLDAHLRALLKAISTAWPAALPRHLSPSPPLSETPPDASTGPPSGLKALPRQRWPATARRQE